MRDGSTTRTRAIAPWGAVGMFLIVAAVESTLAARARDLMTTNLVDGWTDARDDAESTEVRGASVLCLGDSQVKLGLLPTILGPRLGEPAFSLAIHGGQPAAAYMLLRRALDHGARPRAIVIGFFPGLLAADLRINTRQWPEILGVGDCLDLAATAHDPHLGAMTLLRLALRSCRARDQIRNSVSSALRGVDDPERGAILGDRRNRRINRGGLAAPANPACADDFGPPGSAPSLGLTWRPRPENERSLRRLLGLARDRGIAVYWLTTTLSPGAQAYRESHGFDASYEAFLRRMQAEFPDLTVLDTRRLGLDRSAFVDPVHLDERGASVLSAAVADAIAADRPGGPRWVRLGSRPAPGDPRMARGTGPAPRR